MGEKSNKKIYVFDIDGTLCRTEGIAYENSIPIKEAIEAVNKLYDEGNMVRIYTARSSSPRDDWKEITEKSLRDWGVKYHSLHFGKPYGDIYIDDRALNALEWRATLC